MNREKIEYIAHQLYEAEKWRKIGGWGSLIMLAALIIDLWYRDIGSASLLFESALVGAFVCCWGGNFDRSSRFRKELDTICYALFGKSYNSSQLDIIKLDKAKIL